MRGSDSDTLDRVGIKNGDILHVGNQSVELASVAASKATEAPSTSGNATMIDTSGGAKKDSSASDNKPKVGKDGRTNRCHHIAS